MLFVSPLLYLRFCKEAFSAPKNAVVFIILSIVFIIMSFNYLFRKVKLNISASIFLLLFALLAFISVFYSVNPSISFRWALEFSFYAGLFAAVVQIAHGRKNVFFGLLNVALFAGFSVAIIGILQFFHLDFVFRVSNFTGRISSTLGNANFLGGYLILLIPVSLALFFIVGKNLYRLIYGLNTIILLTALFFTQTLNAWLGLALGGCMFGILFLVYVPKYRKLVLITALVMTAVVSVLVFSFKPEEAIGKLAKIGQFKTFAEKGRWLMWKSALEMIKEKPVAGFGAGTFRTQFTKYEAKLLKTEEFKGYPHLITKDAHNDYLQIGSELGISGLLLFLLFISSVVFGAMRGLLKEEKDIKIISIGLLSALLSFMVHMFFNFPLKIAPSAVLFFVFLGLLASIYGVQEAKLGRKYIRAVIFSSCVLLFLIAVPHQLLIFYSNFKLGRAIELEAKKNFSEAMINARAALVCGDLAGNTVDLRTHFYLGQIQYRLLNYKAAEEEFEKEVAQNPYYPDARYNLALIQEINENYKEAYENYEMALKIDSSFEGIKEKMDRIAKIIKK